MIASTFMPDNVCTKETYITCIILKFHVQSWKFKFQIECLKSLQITDGKCVFCSWQINKNRCRGIFLKFIIQTIRKLIPLI